MSLATCIAVLFAFLVHPNDAQIENIFQNFIEETGNFLYNETIPEVTKFRNEYDFIVVGAGSGGSVMANRLTENSKWNVLLLEAGGTGNILSEIPLAAPFLGTTSLNWGYKADPSPNYCTGLQGGQCNWPKGRVIGGTSVINFLIYTRGSRRDYDEWRDLGNYGWGYDDVLKYFKKSENMKIPELRTSPYHQQNGYQDIEYSGYRSKLFKSFLQTGREWGYKISDPNGANQLGFSMAQATMRNGRRCSASKAFIHPVVRRKNLDISLKSWVTKIQIDPDTKTAYGVEFMKGKKRYTVRATKEVILSAGSIASPQLLMLSGVGPTENLKQFDIPVIQDLKVGYNLQDHNSLGGLVFTVNQPVTIIDRETRTNPFYVIDYLFNGQGPFTVPGGAEGIAFVKIPNSTLDSAVPDIELVLGVGGMQGDSSGSLRDTAGMTNEFYYATYKNIIDKHGFGIAPVLLKPKSRGRISLKSKNPFHWPRMEPNFFSDPEDLRGLIEGVKLAVKLGESRHFRQFDAKFNKNPYFGCEHLTFRSDAYWECCVRKVAGSLQHQSGTCKMGPSTDSDAVVDPELRVYGIQNLRVVDASIMPVIPASHTNAVVFMIAEKASDMIKTTWKNQ